MRVALILNVPDGSHAYLQGKIRPGQALPAGVEVISLEVLAPDLTDETPDGRTEVSAAIYNAHPLLGWRQLVDIVSRGCPLLEFHRGSAAILVGTKGSMVRLAGRLEGSPYFRVQEFTLRDFIARITNAQILGLTNPKLAWQRLSAIAAPKGPLHVFYLEEGVRPYLRFEVTPPEPNLYD